MATFRLGFLGFSATIFASGKRAGIELSVPIGALHRKAGDGAATGALPAPTELPSDPRAAALARKVAGITWYHTLDLGHGVVTPGFFDHRPILDRYRISRRLDGLRVLDIATFDGFWAFEFERRGAAEVVALDLATAGEVDLPFRKREGMSAEELARPFGEGFALAHSALGSKVRYVRGNVYGLTPAQFGQFDLVHCGDLLLHLRDPARALWNIRRVTRGYALLSDCIYPDLDRLDDVPLVQYEGGRGVNIWWRFGANALGMMIADAGFDKVEEVTRFRYGPRGQPASMWHAVYRAAP
jgi:tRNA (mo5U34)-methyltransferase